MKFLFILGFFALLPASVQAGCPVGQASSKRQGFSVQLGDLAKGADLKRCEVQYDKAVYEPMDIVGCYPNSDYPEYLQLKVPKGWSHKCFDTAPETIVVPSVQFHVKDNSRVWPFRSGSLMPFPAPGPIEPPVAEDCPDVMVPVASLPVPIKAGSSKADSGAEIFAGRANPIFLVMNDFLASENKLKSVEKLEKYHGCLLSNPWEKKQHKVYMDKYRHVMAAAAAAFNVPLPLLTCLCGRESRFKNDSTSHTGVKGLCQTTALTLKDIEKWRTTIPEVRSAWDDYVKTIGPELESKGCATAKLNPATIAACPSLGFGAASIYLQYANSRVEKNEKFKNVKWEIRDINSLIVISAAYNVGVELTDKVLSSESKNRWQSTLLNSTCSQFSKNKKLAKSKFKELKEHMIALRSCLQEDTWLDHHGKPLKAECTMDAAEVKHQEARLAKYVGSIPSECPN